MTGFGGYCCHDAPEHVLIINVSVTDLNIVVDNIDKQGGSIVIIPSYHKISKQECCYSYSKRQI